MIRINLFYFLLLYYLVVNLFFAINGFINNEVEIEFNYFFIKSSSFLWAFSIQLFICILIFLMYFIFNKRLKRDSNFSISENFSIFLFFLQISFIIYNLYFGVNLAGNLVKSGNWLLNTIFILLPADLFFIAFSPYIKSKKWFYINLVVYTVSTVLRGWMGGVFLAVFIYLIRKSSIVISFRNIFFYILTLIVLVLVLPFLIQSKWIVRDGGSALDAISAVFDSGYWELLGSSMYYVFNRFQHNYHVALLFENYNSIALMYDAGRVLPYWAEGIVQTIFSILLGAEKLPALGGVMAQELFYSRDTWSANPGLAGWFIVLQEKFVILFLYVFALLGFGFHIASKYYDNKMLQVLGVFSILYLFHGWIGMYVSLLTYVYIFSLIRRVRL